MTFKLFSKRGELLMERPLLVLAAIAALGLFYVVFPVILDAFMRYRRIHRVNCPEDEKTALVSIDAKAAALTAAQGKTQLRVINCSFWPARKGCAQGCMAQVA